MSALICDNGITFGSLGQNFSCKILTQPGSYTTLTCDDLPNPTNLCQYYDTLNDPAYIFFASNNLYTTNANGVSSMFTDLMNVNANCGDLMQDGFNCQTTVNNCMGNSNGQPFLSPDNNCLLIKTNGQSPGVNYFKIVDLTRLRQGSISPPSPEASWMYYRWPVVKYDTNFLAGLNAKPSFGQVLPTAVGCNTSEQFTFAFETSCNRYPAVKTVQQVQVFYAFTLQSIVDGVKANPELFTQVLAKLIAPASNFVPNNFTEIQVNKIFDAFIGLNAPTGFCFQAGTNCLDKSPGAGCINYFSDDYNSLCSSLKNPIPQGGTRTNYQQLMDNAFAKLCQSDVYNPACGCINASQQNDYISRLAQNSIFVTNLACWFKKCTGADQSSYIPSTEKCQASKICINDLLNSQVPKAVIDTGSLIVDQANTCQSNPNPPPPGPSPAPSPPTPSTQTSGNIWLYVGLGVGGFVFLLLIILIIFMARKR